MELFFKRKEFKEQVINRLRAINHGYAERLRLIDEKRKQGEKYSASGVLIPLEFDRQQGEWVMILNKRSDYVQQPGDLCFPGGGIGQRADRVIRFLLNRGVFTSRSSTLNRLRKFSPSERKAVTLILATALRESWEEMRLPPWKVEFLGVLPVYSLMQFTKSIFPVVGLLKGNWRVKTNWEVEKVIRIPVRAFYDSGNYIRYLLGPPDPPGSAGNRGGYDAPAFVVTGSGEEDILWGATYSIVMDFLKLTLDFPRTGSQENKVIKRTLPLHYFTGRTR